MKPTRFGGRFRIGMALMLGVFLMLGALFLKGDATAAPDLNDPRSFAVTAPQRYYQDTADTDGDGMRDWLEELVGTNPQVSDATGTATAATTTDFVADTETKKFAVSFFEEMLKTHGGKNLTDEEKRAILEKSAKNFSHLSATRTYTEADVTVSDDSSEPALRTYANMVGEAITIHGANPKGLPSELVLLGTAVQEDDPKYLADLPVIRNGYEGMRDAIIAVPVPRTLLTEHLLIINALSAVGEDIAAFEKTFTDPLVSLLHFRRYTADVEAMTKGFSGLAAALNAQGLSFDQQEGGSVIPGMTQ